MAAKHHYNGGFGGGALTTTTAGDVGADGAELVRRLVASGLRGRGGGWFPAGLSTRDVDDARALLRQLSG